MMISVLRNCFLNLNSNSKYKENYIKYWGEQLTDAFNVSKMQFICEYKRNFQFESYLDNLSFEYRSKVSKIRLSDHRLPIEKLRYEKIDKSERIHMGCM